LIGHHGLLPWFDSGVPVFHSYGANLQMLFKVGGTSIQEGRGASWHERSVDILNA
jgi:hypothetical protein